MANWSETKESKEQNSWSAVLIKVYICELQVINFSRPTKWQHTVIHFSNTVLTKTSGLSWLLWKAKFQVTLCLWSVRNPQDSFEQTIWVFIYYYLETTCFDSAYQMILELAIWFYLGLGISGQITQGLCSQGWDHIVVLI